MELNRKKNKTSAYPKIVSFFIHATNFHRGLFRKGPLRDISDSKRNHSKSALPIVSSWFEELP